MIQEHKEYHYQPGSCNLGKTEINRRFRLGFIGLGAMIGVVLINEVFNLPSFFKIFLFIPAFYFFSGFIQAFNKFCYVYGLKGLASLTGRKKFIDVSEKENFKKDRKKAFIIIAFVTLSSAGLTIVYFLLSR